MLIKIEGKRRLGKSRLLAHYIKDAQVEGRHVLLTGNSYFMCRKLEKIFSFKADKTTNSDVIGNTTLYDVLAIEEIDCKKWKKYLKKYKLNLTKNAVCIITGDLK